MAESRFSLPSLGAVCKETVITKAEIQQRLFLWLEPAALRAILSLGKLMCLCCIIDRWLIYDILFCHFHFSKCSISMRWLFKPSQLPTLIITQHSNHNFKILQRHNTKAIKPFGSRSSLNFTELLMLTKLKWTFLRGSAATDHRSWLQFPAVHWVLGGNYVMWKSSCCRLEYRKLRSASVQL